MSEDLFMKRYDSLLDVAVLQTALQQIDGWAEARVLFCYREPGDFQFHIQLPDGKIVGNFGGVRGYNAKEYAASALGLRGQKEVSNQCPHCGRTIWRSISSF